MKNAFSLVELSIVLVILGLLTGGILTGQSLIRAAELRSVTTEFQRYQSAVNTFRDKYFALPGDMRNATAFWGMQAAGAACVTASSTSQATCNGDGDGIINYAAPTSNETFRFWQHLANAGLIEGSYNGVEGSSGNSVHSIPGLNVPRSKISNTGYSLYHYGNYTTSCPGTCMYDGNYGTAMFLGTTTTTSITNLGGFKAEEAWNIDTKLDDGRPAFGNVRNYNATARPDCTTSDTPADTNYDLQATSETCPIIFITGY